MQLQKFGIKLFLNINENYFSKDFIPVFHDWIQKKSVSDHLLIDVADYSHIPDGPGVMLISHEGHFSLDQENYNPGMMYMRKTELKGDFKERFRYVLSITIDAAKQLKANKINKKINFYNNSFRFVANDRLYAKNTIENQNLYKEEIQKTLYEIYPNCSMDINAISNKEERLAFTINFDDGVDILD